MPGFLFSYRSTIRFSLQMIRSSRIWSRMRRDRRFSIRALFPSWENWISATTQLRFATPAGCGLSEARRMRVVSRAVLFSFVFALSIHPLDTVHQSYPNIPYDSNSTWFDGKSSVSQDIFYENHRLFRKESISPTTLVTPKVFQKIPFNFLTIRGSYPHQYRVWEKGFTRCPERFRWLARAYTCV